jgi:hypothetical protein
VTSNEGPITTPNGFIIPTSLRKITNTDLLNECIDNNLIEDNKGWNLVIQYNSTINGVYTKTDLSFRLRHSDGRIVPIDSIIDMKSVAVSGGGKASFLREKISGSLSRHSIYEITIKIKGDTLVFHGAIPLNLKISGTREESYGIANAATASLTGYKEGDYNCTAMMVLKIAAFKRLDNER